MGYSDPTDNYGWDLPANLGDTDAWGGLTNEYIGAIVGSIIESIDTVLGLLKDESDTLTSDIAALDARARALVNVPIYARVYRAAAAQSISDATPLVLEWDTEVFDQGGLFDLANPTDLKVPADQGGTYEIRAVLRVEVSAEGDDSRQWIVRIKKNATPIAVAHYPALNDGIHDELSGERTITLSVLDEASAEDVFTVEVEQSDVHGFTAPASFVVSGEASSYFEMSRLRSPDFGEVWTMYEGTWPINSWTGLHSIIAQGATANANQGDDEIRYVLFRVSEEITIDRIIIGDQQAGTSVATVRVGIYDSDPDTRLPANLLGQTDDIVVDQNVKSDYEANLLSPVVLSPGVHYWYAFGVRDFTSGTNLNMEGWEQRNTIFMTDSSFSGSDVFRGALEVTVVGWGPGLPDPADVTTSATMDVNAPAVGARRSA